MTHFDPRFTAGPTDDRGLLDLEYARTFTRQSIARDDGSPLTEAVVPLARALATKLAQRDGRDMAAAADLLLDAASCLGGLIAQVPPMATVETLVLVNLISAAALELDRIREASA